MSQGEGGGRPTAYRAAFCRIAKVMTNLGATDREVAEGLGVSEVTLNAWKHKHPKFLKSLSVGKKSANRRVELSLYRKATGYSFDAVKIFIDEGAAVIVPYVEHVPPSDRAIEYWLNNREKKRWQNRQALEHSTPPGRPLQVETYVPGAPQLLQDYYAKIAQSSAAADSDPQPARPLGPTRPEWEEPGDGEDFSPR
jgi:hypothetical protein